MADSSRGGGISISAIPAEEAVDEPNEGGIIVMVELSFLGHFENVDMTELAVSGRSRWDPRSPCFQHRLSTPKRV